MSCAPGWAIPVTGEKKDRREERHEKDMLQDRIHIILLPFIIRRDSIIHKRLVQIQDRLSRTLPIVPIFIGYCPKGSCLFYNRLMENDGGIIDIVCLLNEFRG